MNSDYLDDLEIIEDFGFNSYPIFELATLLAMDLCSARIITINYQEIFDDTQIEDRITNEMFIEGLSPHVKNIEKKIINSLKCGEIKASYTKKDFTSGQIDTHNTLINLHEFNVFLDIYDLQQHIIWHEDESSLGLRVEQEQEFYYRSMNLVRERKKYTSSRVLMAEIEELHGEMKTKLESDPDFINSIISENIEYRLKQRIDDENKLREKKPVNIRTENNYLRLILTLANGIENFNPKKPFEAAQLIIDETGIDLGKETIANCISKAYELESKNRD